MSHTCTATQPIVAPPLHDNDIHVWSFNYHPSRKRIPLRHILATYLNTSVERVDFITSKHGRPALATPHDWLQFNWSHSGQHAVLALARGVIPGIDVEERREHPRALAIANRYFRVEEATHLATLPDAQRTAAFLLLWTAKEAVLKAIGRGLAYGLDRLLLDVPPAPLRLLYLDGDEASAWQLMALPIHPTVVASLAWRGGWRQIRLYQAPEQPAYT